MELRGSIRVQGVPPADAGVQERLCAYQNTRNASFAGFLADKGLLITTRFADSAQVHHVREPMGMRKQITFFKEPVKGCLPCPRGASAVADVGFIYGADVGGDEQLQFSFFDFKSGKSKRFTDGTSKHLGACWAADGSAIAFSSNERDGTHFDVYLLSFSDLRGEQEIINRQKRLVMQNADPGYYWTTGAVKNKNGSTTLLVHHYISVSNSQLFLVEAPGGARTKIAPSGVGDAAVGSARLVLRHASSSESAADAAGGDAALGVLFSSNQGSNFHTLRFYHARSGSSTELLGEKEVPWDVEDICVEAVTGVFVVAYNVDGCSQLRWGRLKIDQAGGALEFFEKLEIAIDGVLGKMELTFDSAKGAVLGFSLIAANAPFDVYTVELGKLQPLPSDPRSLPSQPMRWTESEVGGLNTVHLAQPSLIRLRSFDGLEFSAFVYRPPTSSAGSKRKGADGKVPVIVHPHGGPEGQHRPVFSPMIQFLVCELGLCVIDPNVRGSDGYGKVFVNLDNGYNREHSVRDLEAVLDWIDGDGSLDASRVAVWGGSYGGYMVLASLVHFSARLKCGIDMVGISNFVTFLENTADYRRDLRRVKYGDERDPAMRKHLLAISPLTNVAKIQRPLFIIQGANDPRVPLSEAEQIQKGVEANGQTVWYMVADDEGHGFAKKKNIDQYQVALVAFCEQFLLGD